MPRVSFGYKLGEKNVIKGGYGIYYDTLNARDWTPNQDGYDVTTTNQLSSDFGQTSRWAIRGTASCRWPIRSRCAAAPAAATSPVSGNALGVDTMLGQGFTAENPNRKHSRVQRWRLGWQRELNRAHGDRHRLLRLVRRSAGHRHPAGLSAGAVLEQRQRPRHLGERLS